MQNYLAHSHQLEDGLQVPSIFNPKMTVGLWPAVRCFGLAISRGRPLLPRLRRKGHAIIVTNGSSRDKPEHVASRKKELSSLRQAYSAPLTGKVDGYGYPFNEGVQIRLDFMAERWWCVFEPFTYVELPRQERGGESSPGENVSSFVHVANPSIDWQRERWLVDAIRNGHALLLDGQKFCLEIAVVLLKLLVLKMILDQVWTQNFSCLPLQHGVGPAMSMITSNGAGDEYEL
ncbi:Uncharacterised protein [Serratia rubidaea]|uniref:Uncharacterized protein n=1 Tax=Serratia rubidaea TaxID=61652 RepID=A0A3S4FNG6_SERRU|nr:Uncharacterised protein [Serratia rubidaea]